MYRRTNWTCQRRICHKKLLCIHTYTWEGELGMEKLAMENVSVKNVFYETHVMPNTQSCSVFNAIACLVYHIQVFANIHTKYVSCPDTPRRGRILHQRR